jgi:hypothetical protein
MYFIQIKLKKKKKDMINMKVVYCCIKPPKENKGKRWDKQAFDPKRTPEKLSYGKGSKKDR